MTLSANDYRQFAHDVLNIVGRLQSATELAEIADDDLRSLLERDIQNLTRAVKIFSRLGWCDAHPSIDKDQKVDLSTLLFEVVSADRPEGMLVAIDENINVTGDKALIQSILEELVHNIAAHADLAAPSKVVLQKTTKGATLTLSNKIKETPPENAQAPFVKGVNSHGLGIGLMMVRKLATLIEADFTFETDGETALAQIIF